MVQPDLKVKVGNHVTVREKMQSVATQNECYLSAEGSVWEQLEEGSWGKPANLKVSVWYGVDC